MAFTVFHRDCGQPRKGWAGGDKHPKLLIVEGQDDVELVGALLKRLRTNPQDEFQFYAADGKENIVPALELIAQSSAIKTGDVSTVAVIWDNDPVEPLPFAAVAKGFGDARLPVPSEAGKVEDGKPRVGAFVLPSATATGELENLCLDSVIDDRDVMSCVKAYMECLKDKGVELRKPAKACAQVFLASHPKLPRGIGGAVKSGCWNLSAGVWNDLKYFLSQL